MTNEQNIQTKKWNKLSVGVFCLSFIFSVPALLSFFIRIEIINFFDVYWDNQEYVFLINFALFVLSIIAIIRVRKFKQKGIYLGIMSLFLSLLPIGLLILGGLALGVLNMG